MTFDVHSRLKRIALLALLCALAACAPATTSPSPHASASASARPSASAAAVTAAPAPPNAPAIVQVENSQFARPQSGLADATIVYEYVAEGGISRFSAIYAVPPASVVGPVRSARLATIELLRLYGAVLMYSGGSHYINGLLSQSALPHYDETAAGGDLFRIGSRSAPHNLYTDGAHIRELLGKARAQPISYSFPVISAVPAGGRLTSSFRVPVSTFERPSWKWDQTLRAWTRTEPDTGPFLDGVTGQPLQAATVIVQQVQITTSAQVVDVNGVHGVDHKLTGTGAAQVFVAGREYNATWTQPAAGAPQFTLADGRPAPMAPGLLWIELVATGSPALLTP